MSIISRISDVKIIPSIGMEDTPITQSDAGLCPERFIDFILLVLRYADQNIRP